MIIQLQSEYLEAASGKTTVFCNGKMVPPPVKNCWEIAGTDDELLISMEFKNPTFNGKMRLLFVLVVWAAGFASGTPDLSLFGYPYDYVLKFVIKNVPANAKVVVRANDYKHANPFSVFAVKLNIIQNNYVAVPGYKWKWTICAVFPILLASSFIFFIFAAILLEHAGLVPVLIMVFLTLGGFTLYGKYIYKILTLDKLRN